MPDEPLIPSQDENDHEPSDADAFSSYVNNHLDLSDLDDDDTDADAEQSKRSPDVAGRLSALLDDHDPWEVDDDDADDDEMPRPSGIFGVFRPNLSPAHHDEDDESTDERKLGLRPSAPSERPTLGDGKPASVPPSGSRSSYDPPLRTGGGFGVFPSSIGDLFPRPPGDQALPPRIPIPSASDSRWMLYRFRTHAHLEIHHPASLTAPVRSTLIPDPVTMLHGRLHAIPAVAPGWVAVKITLSMRQPIIGFVRANQIHLMPAKPTPSWTTRLYNLAISKRGSRLIQSILLLAISVLMLLMLIVLLFEPRPQSMPDLAAVEARLEEQAERIEQLELRLHTLGLR